MNDTKTINRLSQEIEELTEMLNRVRSVIRGNLAVNLDPCGELQMTREEYQAKMDKLQETSDKHDARKKVLAGISADELDQLIDEHTLDEICEALAG